MTSGHVVIRFTGRINGEKINSGTVTCDPYSKNTVTIRYSPEMRVWWVMDLRARTSRTPASQDNIEEAPMDHGLSLRALLHPGDAINILSWEYL